MASRSAPETEMIASPVTPVRGRPLRPPLAAACAAAFAAFPAFAVSCSVLLASVALGGCGATAPTARTPARVALVIGNAAYLNAQPLNNPVNDAQDMCKALQGVGFVTLCWNDVRTRQEFAAHVDEFVGRLGPATVGVVFYAGHGVQVGGANFLVPTQGQPIGSLANPVSALYGVDELFERLRDRPARLNIIMLDACRTELFDDAARADAKRGPATAAAAPKPPASRLLRELKALPRAGTGLAAVRDAPPRTVVFYATAAKSAAFDGDGRNGPLTKHILKNIGTQGQTLDVFFEKVSAAVEAETLRENAKRQSPATYRTSAERFCFAKCPGEGIEVPPIN